MADVSKLKEDNARIQEDNARILENNARILTRLECLLVEIGKSIVKKEATRVLNQQNLLECNELK